MRPTPKKSPAEDPQAPAGTRKPAGKGHGRASDAVREKAILALLSQRTIGLAAERCGVHERTLRDWLANDAAFKADYDVARAALFQAGMSRIQALTSRAVETLEELLDAKTPAAVRLGAARTVTELAIHQHDADVILRKLDEIEAAQQGLSSARVSP